MLRSALVYVLVCVSWVYVSYIAVSLCFSYPSGTFLLHCRSHRGCPPCPFVSLYLMTTLAYHVRNYIVLYPQPSGHPSIQTGRYHMAGLDT
ncbi:hypothetical protein F5Y08DRAFT_302414 [Xylaria arbuscula]|nr:hypothetical protein F5Y08DRAFT_302414 [Xylaria arbuscula]